MMIKSVSFIIGVVAVSSVALADLPADPWANQSPVQDKQANSMNTLHQEKINFVGENTTWNTAMGQKEIAPDANITNMLLMTKKLREMGYQIPDGLDEFINTAPAKIRNEIAKAMNQLQGSDHPIATMEKGLAELFEENTGLSLENLIMNSINIIDNRR